LLLLGRLLRGVCVLCPPPQPVPPHTPTPQDSAETAGSSCRTGFLGATIVCVFFLVFEEYLRSIHAACILDTTITWTNCIYSTSSSRHTHTTPFDLVLILLFARCEVIFSISIKTHMLVVLLSYLSQARSRLPPSSSLVVIVPQCSGRINHSTGSYYPSMTIKR
jgi:hypothetical protein